MSAYTVYLQKVENALLSAVDNYVTKQKIDADGICTIRMKTRILSMYADMIPLLHNCECVEEEQFNQIQNHIIKLTGTPSIGLIDQDDLSCGGISTQIIHVTGGEPVEVYGQQECRSLTLVKNVPYPVNFGQSIGLNGSAWVFPGKPFCYNSFGEVGFGITNRTSNGFTVTADDDCTFEFCVLGIGSGSSTRTFYDNGVFDMNADTPTPVTFNITMPKSNYSLQVECYDVTGTLQQHRLTNVTINGFTVETIVNVTVRWEAETYA